jgi:hypothetical protein
LLFQTQRHVTVRQRFMQTQRIFLHAMRCMHARMSHGSL